LNPRLAVFALWLTIAGQFPTRSNVSGENLVDASNYTPRPCLARFVVVRNPVATSIIEKEIVARGDIAAMLKLSRGDKFFPLEKVTIRQVVTGNALWRPSKEADVLLLGDSFSNIFSFEAMGWGESAGFAEHLSVALRRPIDCILRNSGASLATREILSNELARGRDRLAGKNW
jgi:hypothetical protein